MNCMADSAENYQLDLGGERVKSLDEDVIHVEKDDTMCKWQRHEPGAITVDKCSRLFTLSLPEVIKMLLPPILFIHYPSNR